MWNLVEILAIALPIQMDGNRMWLMMNTFRQEKVYVWSDVKWGSQSPFWIILPIATPQPSIAKHDLLLLYCNLPLLHRNHPLLHRNHPLLHRNHPLLHRNVPLLYGILPLLNRNLPELHRNLPLLRRNRQVRILTTMIPIKCHPFKTIVPPKDAEFHVDSHCILPEAVRPQ